jgi:Flp pilus assembly CpaE family ATPase
MKLLESYRTPGEDELKNFTLDDAEKLDALNKEIHLRNRLIVHNARAILQEVDPAAKMLREIEAPVPPLVYTRVVLMLGVRGSAGAATFAKNAAKKPGA